MEARVKSLREHLYSRRCMMCGYDGPQVQNHDLDFCIECGTDLRHRPPRSYAEMEGFLGQAVTIDSPLNDPRRRYRLMRHWFAFLMLTLSGVVLIGYLLAALLGG